MRRRLAVLRHVEEVSGNVAMTCRYYGISRPTYYKWLHRYETEGVDGLHDRSERPRTSPDATRGSAGKDRPPAAALPLRARQDRHVPDRNRETSGTVSSPTIDLCIEPARLMPDRADCV
ncbi:helix-turn-helix domain-containing protein [Saccharopolyspora pogona]|uniref:helix-turn-helix domain-containing protein n=1 Tax=Saccharopolyspora pogona TaxID=333966 RepID=UPI0016866425